MTRWLHDAREGDMVSITRGQGAFVFLPDMGEDISALLRELGVSASRIIFEKWW